MLTDNNIHIWDIWADEHGNVGPLYGYQWRHWRTDQHYLVQEAHKGAYEIDQVTEVMNSLRNKPEARSHVISAWRPDHLKLMSIKPCHVFLQFYLVNGELSLHMTQRSCDAFLGVPFNIAQYSALVHMIAQQLGVKAKEFIWTGNDVHIYENHVDQVKEQLLNTQYAFPTLTFNRKPDSIFDYKWEDFQINHYVSAGTIKADVSAQGTPGICTNLPEFQRFKYDDHVEKIAGAIFSGRVRGYYHTDLTETGYAIEADAYPGTVQIYPENALKPKE
jgi:thymidylate synthase